MKDVEYWELISPKKDVDGLTSDSCFQPCTPKGIVYLLEKELGDLTGKSALIIGRSKLVGRPLANMLLDKDCTVTVAHSKSTEWDVTQTLLHTDIVVSAVGKPNFLNLNTCFSEIVVDVGINRDANGKLCGDCYEDYEEPCSGLLVTPVPNGVGLLTRAMLMKNVAEVSQME
jgi:methylenetetrahydrofolate dehydrogenase (NADP+)/methenyltetrahydrofolate cyclohydrolase